jgi:Secretion system C-terminal sorting domain
MTKKKVLLLYVQQAFSSINLPAGAFNGKKIIFKQPLLLFSSAGSSLNKRYYFLNAVFLFLFLLLSFFAFSNYPKPFQSSLHTAIPVSLSSTTEVPFMVTADAASQNPDRFRVVFAFGNKTIDNSITTKSRMTAYPNPLSGRTINLQLVDQPKGTYRAVLVNSAGQTVFEGRIQHQGGTATHALQLTNKLAKGVYQIQVAGGEGRTTLQVISN